MILVRLSIVVLASSRLPPKTFCELEGTGDRVVKNAIVFARLAGESDGEHAGLNAQLEDATTVRARGREGAFRALISSSRASGDRAEFWPGVVVWEHWERIEADRKRRGREWRRKQEGKRKGMRRNSCNWRMARPSLTLQRMGIFNRTQVHFGGFPICHHVHLSTSSSVYHLLPYQVTRAPQSYPAAYPLLLSHAESPLLPQKNRHRPRHVMRSDDPTARTGFLTQIADDPHRHRALQERLRLRLRRWNDHQRWCVQRRRARLPAQQRTLLVRRCP